MRARHFGGEALSHAHARTLERLAVVRSVSLAVAGTPGTEPVGGAAARTAARLCRSERYQRFGYQR
jgi:hypothetical protein